MFENKLIMPDRLNFQKGHKIRALIMPKFLIILNSKPFVDNSLDVISLQKINH